MASMASFGLVLSLALPAQTLAAEVVLESLRGDAAINEPDQAGTIHRPKTGERFVRNYRQQPPLIPHKTDKYQIDIKANECIGCHDWPQYVEQNAPKISETHYLSPTGKRLNKVSGSRWFCNQCHVPQVDAKALVENTFKPSGASQ